jgi:DNA-binding NarL/FixJ family response regulator
MARIDLSGPGAPVNGKSGQPTPYGLTERELDVLRLLIDGLTNSEIGARLYISRKTASVHVTSILRKLGATNRVHAAAIAQRAGVLDS